MDAKKVTLIQESWGRLEGDRTELAEAFYARLFHICPRIHDLFAATDMESQPAKFAAMLGELVGLVGNPDRFEALLAASGRRHAEYGVSAQHYHAVGEALLWALDRYLPSGMDSDTREAWAEAYTRMAFVMQQATV